MHVRHVVFGNERRHVQLDFRSRIQRPFKIGLLAGFQRRHGALQQFHVQVVADLLDLAALFIAQQLAGAANFQIMSRQGKSGAQLLERLQRFEALDAHRRSSPFAAA